MKWFKNLILILSIPTSLLILITLLFLYPGWAYAHHTEYHSFVIQHDSELQEGWFAILDSVEKRIQGSGIHDESLIYKICLKDGSSYPNLIESVAGESFAFAGVDIIILQSQPDPEKGIATRGDLIYDLVTLLSHEAIHCQEYRHQGFWGANPMAGHPVWKWEGFAELKGRGSRFLQSQEQVEQYWSSAREGGWITLDDKSMVHSSYLQFALLSHLCLKANDHDFDAFLADERPESYWVREMEKLTRSTYLGT